MYLIRLTNIHFIRLKIKLVYICCILMSNLNKNKYIFQSILYGTYQRETYPHIVNIIPLHKCLQDLDLLASSITYSITTPYYNRDNYYWPLIRRGLCNGDKSKLIYISLIFNKPTTIDDLRVTYIKDIKELNLLNCSLNETVLSNLKHIIRE